jgi:hypothetical protein
VQCLQCVEKEEVLYSPHHSIQCHQTNNKTQLAGGRITPAA